MNIIEDSLKLFDFIIMSFSTVGYEEDGISNDNTNTIPLRLFCDLIIKETDDHLTPLILGEALLNAHLLSN
jgi:hypothetical protein